MHCLPLRRLFAGLAATLLVASCTSPPVKGEPYEPLGPVEEPPIGYFLANFDNRLNAWSRMRLSPTSAEDLRIMRALEQEMTYLARKWREPLLEQLETGPPKNRAVAAVALGFSRDPIVQGPLLAALSDRDEEVVHNALIGVGLLGLPDTPLAQMMYLLRNHPDAWTRNNAAYALQRVVAAGARSDELSTVCRDSLLDDEPGVRAQSAAILGLLEDQDSIENLGDRLYDDVRLVASAAASSLGHIGRGHAEQKGTVARLLVDALDSVERSHRSLVQGELLRLADRDLGEETEDWKEWAYRIP